MWVSFDLNICFIVQEVFCHHFQMIWPFLSCLLFLDLWNAYYHLLNDVPKVPIYLFFHSCSWMDILLPYLLCLLILFCLPEGPLLESSHEVLVQFIRFKWSDCCTLLLSNLLSNHTFHVVSLTSVSILRRSVFNFT